MGSSAASPYTAQLEARTNRSAPASTAWRTALTVPPWVTESQPTGSSTDCATDGTAARWTTASQPSAASRMRTSSRTSPSITCSPAPPWAARAHAPSRFSSLPVLKSSTTRTSDPLMSSASTTCDPMKPAPPVTRVSPSMGQSYGRARVTPPARRAGLWRGAHRGRARPGGGETPCRCGPWRHRCRHRSPRTASRLAQTSSPVAPWMSSRVAPRTASRVAPRTASRRGAMDVITGGAKRRRHTLPPQPRTGARRLRSGATFGAPLD